MADDELREAERAWRQDEADAAAAARYAAALRRGGRPAPSELRAARSYAPRSVDAAAPLEVWATLPHGERRRVGRTPGPVEVPEHRDWALRARAAEHPPARLAAALADALRPDDDGEGGGGLELDLAGAAPDRQAAALGALAGLPVESLTLWSDDALGPDRLAAVARLPRLASLRWYAERPVLAATLAPLRDAPRLAGVTVWAPWLRAGVVAALAALPALTDLTLSVLLPEAGEEDEPSTAAAELAGLRAARGLRRLDLSSLHQWRLGDPALAELGRLEGLVGLDLPLGGYTNAGLARLARRRLDALGIASASLDDGCAPTLEALPLRRLRLLTADLGPAGLGRLPPSLVELAVEAPADGDLAWLARLPGLRTLNLSLRPTSEGDDLHALGSLPALRALGLTFPRRTPDEITVPTATADDLRHAGACRGLEALTVVGAPGPLGERVVGAWTHLPLRSLVLWDVALDAAGAARLAACPTLERLDLRYLETLDDEAFAALTRLPRLRAVSLLRCPRVSRAALDRLRRARPEVDVGAS